MNSPLRHDWNKEEILELYSQPFNDLIFQAHTTHRERFDPNEVQISTLLSIKTGGCAEDCKYCPQSAHFDTGLQAEKLMDISAVKEAAQQAKAAGASRFCMGAAWRNPKPRHMDALCEMVEEVKSLGLETCMTLGMLEAEQAAQLKEAGLDYYNHNLDTSEEYYDNVITTRTYEDRLNTLQHVRDSGMNVCCGGIIGMGEALEDRASMIATLANLPEHPKSVPINRLVAVEGTPFAQMDDIDDLDFIRTIAVTRIVMPASYVRLSAGRETMNESMQALCFFAGANSIFYGEKLLTTPNPEANQDRELFDKLGLKAA